MPLLDEAVTYAMEQAALTTLTAEEQARLEVSHQRWLQHRDAHCAVSSPTPVESGALPLSCMVELTMERAARIWRDFHHPNVEVWH